MAVLVRQGTGFLKYNNGAEAPGGALSWQLSLLGLETVTGVGCTLADTVFLSLSFSLFLSLPPSLPPFRPSSLSFFAAEQAPLAKWRPQGGLTGSPLQGLAELTSQPTMICKRA